MITLFGRRSSHFTRLARIYGEDLGLDLDYRPILDLMSDDPRDYGGHPALKMPALDVDGEVVFGSLPVCRELVRLSGDAGPFLWPENLPGIEARNAQELVTQAMATEVTLIIGRVNGQTQDNAQVEKARRSLRLSLEWLERRMPGLIANLPDCRLAFLEVSMFCLVEHLGFREVMDTAPFPALRDFAAEFARRPAARATSFEFDQA